DGFPASRCPGQDAGCGASGDGDRTGMSDVLESRRDGRLLCLAMNRPEKRNALNAALCADLNARLVEAEPDPEIGAVMLTGNGKGFSAGMDLDEALTTEAGTLADL